jgi:hypothetical protein
LRKTHPDGSVKEYAGDLAPEDWQANPWDDRPEGWTKPNLVCDCGSESFKVCWWDYPYTGGYCRVVCAGCGEDLLLIDDYW